MEDIVNELVELTRRGDRVSAAAAIAAWRDKHSDGNLIFAVMRPFLERIGEEWQQSTLSLAQAYVATRIAEDAINAQVATAGAGRKPEELKGPVIIGNAEDDFHALGRMMVALMLKADGWDVRDLGNDVSAEMFVDTAVRTGARVIGVSAMMHKTARNIVKIRRMLDERRLSGRIKLAVGGAVFKVDPGLADEVGGDATCPSAASAPKLFERLWGETTAVDTRAMTSRDRVMASLKGEPVDRRPFVPILSLYGARLIDAPLERYYREPALYAAGQAAALKLFRPDVLFTPLCFPGEAEAFGAELKYYPDRPPNIQGFPVSSAAEFLRAKLPDPEQNPSLQYFRESLRLMVSSAGPDVPVGAILLNPVDLPSVVMGMHNWLETLMSDHRLRSEVCDRTADYFVARGNALLADGASFLVSSGGFLSRAIATRELVETFIAPVLRQAFARIRGPIVIHDAGSSILPFMDLYKGLPNVVALYASARDDIGEARLRAGSDCALVACMDGPMLDHYHAEDIYSRCVSLLEKLKGEPRLLLGTSGPDIPLETPPENIEAMLRAVELTT